MGHKKESRDHDERRKCRRQSNSPSAKRARKNRSHSNFISVKSKTYRKGRHYQSTAESLSESLSQSSSESLSQCPSPQKKHGSGNKQHSASFKQRRYRKKHKRIH